MPALFWIPTSVPSWNWELQRQRVIKSNEEAGKINFGGLSAGLGSACCFLFLFCSLVMVPTCKEHAIFLRSVLLQKAIHALCSEITLTSLGNGLSRYSRQIAEHFWLMLSSTQQPKYDSCQKISLEEHVLQKYMSSTEMNKEDLPTWERDSGVCSSDRSTSNYDKHQELELRNNCSLFLTMMLQRRCMNQSAGRLKHTACDTREPSCLRVWRLKVCIGSNAFMEKKASYEGS